MLVIAVEGGEGLLEQAEDVLYGAQPHVDVVGTDDFQDLCLERTC